MEHLTTEQITNWRRVLAGMIGPYALLMPDEEIERLCHRMNRDAQLRIGADDAGAGESRMIYSCPKCGEPRNRYDSFVQECLHCGDASIILSGQE